VQIALNFLPLIRSRHHKQSKAT